MMPYGRPSPAVMHDNSGAVAVVDQIDLSGFVGGRPLVAAFLDLTICSGEPGRWLERDFKHITVSVEIESRAVQVCFRKDELVRVLMMRRNEPEPLRVGLQRGVPRNLNAP